MKRLFKYISIYIFSGVLYITIELFFRHRTDITMFLLAGICGLILAGLNNIYTYELDFSIQVILSTFCITLGEYIFGVIFNSDYHIWDYRNLPFSINGYVNLYFSLMWLVIATFGIPLLDYIEWKVFKYKYEIPPYYKIFGKKIFQFKLK